MENVVRAWGQGRESYKEEATTIPIFFLHPSASPTEQKQSTELCSRVKLLESSNFLLMCPQLVNINFIIIMNPHQGNNKHLSVYINVKPLCP